MRGGERKRIYNNPLMKLGHLLNVTGRIKYYILSVSHLKAGESRGRKREQIIIIKYLPGLLSRTKYQQQKDRPAAPHQTAPAGCRAEWW